MTRKRNNNRRPKALRARATDSALASTETTTSPVQRGSSASDQQLITVTHMRQEVRLQQGLLAATEELARLEELVPGAAKIIIEDFREQGPHRRKMEATALKIDGNSSFRGQAFGLIVSLAFLGVSAFLINEGHDMAGTVLGTVDIVALVGVFVYGANTRRQEREERMKLLTGQTEGKKQGRQTGR